MNKINQLNRNGFTLIELLVAITILAVLSTIGLAFYQQAEVSARDGRRMGDMQEAQKALEQYYSIFRQYPADGTFYTDANLPKYFQAGSVPKDPDGNNYTYKQCLQPQKYVLCSTDIESCDGKCNRAKSTVSGLDPCTTGPSDGTNPTGTTGAFCVGSLSN